MSLLLGMLTYRCSLFTIVLDCYFSYNITKNILTWWHETPVYLSFIFCFLLGSKVVYVLEMATYFSRWFCAPWQWKLLFPAMYRWITMLDVLLARCWRCSFGEDFKHSCWHDLPSSAGNNHQRYVIILFYMSWRMFAYLIMGCADQIFLIIVLRSMELLISSPICLYSVYIGLTISIRHVVQRGSKRTWCSCINACCSHSQAIACLLPFCPKRENLTILTWC